MKKVITTLTFLILAFVLVSTRTHEINVVADARPSEAAPTTTARTMMVRTVTAYTLGRVEETDASPCIGAFNNNLCDIVKSGTNVCASNEFPKGTRLQIGELECVVLDRMNKRYANRVDIAMLDYWRARMFGKQELTIEIIQ